MQVLGKGRYNIVILYRLPTTVCICLESIRFGSIRLVCVRFHISWWRVVLLIMIIINIIIYQAEKTNVKYNMMSIRVQ